jgi:hypothetical protein
MQDKTIRAPRRKMSGGNEIAVDTRRKESGGHQIWGGKRRKMSGGNEIAVDTRRKTP